MHHVFPLNSINAESQGGEENTASSSDGVQLSCKDWVTGRHCCWVSCERLMTLTDLHHPSTTVSY